MIASLTEVGPAMAGKAGTHIVPDAPAQGREQARRRGREGRRQAGRQEDAPHQAPAKKPRQRSRRSPGAEVIDISTRRRAVAE